MVKTNFGDMGQNGWFAYVKGDNSIAIGFRDLPHGGAVLYRGPFHGDITPHMSSIRSSNRDLYDRIMEHYNNDRKYYFEIKKGANGLLKDGRQFNVTSIPKIMMCSDGTMRWGDVELTINGEPCVIRISELIENISTIGDLTIG